MDASVVSSAETADKRSVPAAERMGVSVGEAEDEAAAHKLSSPPEHPLLPRFRHRRLMAFLLDQGFDDSYNELMDKTRAHMSLSHLRCLVERGQWGDAVEYLERYLPPGTPPRRPWSLRAQVLHHFLLMHRRFANAVDGCVDKFVPRNYFQLSNARAVSHAQLRLRSISFSILAVGEVRANMNWQAVRNKASLVVHRLVHSTPELRGCIELPATSNKPHHVLPIASSFSSRRRYVKKKQTGRTKAIIRALKGQSLMVPEIGSIEEALELLADLLDETLRDGVQLITYGQFRPLQLGGNEGAQSCQPMLDTFRVATTYRTLANAGTNKLLAEPGSDANTARQDLDGRRNSREEPAIAEEDRASRCHKLGMQQAGRPGEPPAQVGNAAGQKTGGAVGVSLGCSGPRDRASRRRKYRMLTARSGGLRGTTVSLHLPSQAVHRCHGLTCAGLVDHSASHPHGHPQGVWGPDDVVNLCAKLCGVSSGCPFSTNMLLLLIMLPAAWA